MLFCSLEFIDCWNDYIKYKCVENWKCLWYMYIFRSVIEGFYSVLCQICDSIIYQYTKKINQHTVSFYHVSIYWYIEQCGVTPTETLVSTIIIWINNCLMFGCNFKFFISKKILLLLMYIYSLEFKFYYAFSIHSGLVNTCIRVGARWQKRRVG